MSGIKENRDMSMTFEIEVEMHKAWVSIINATRLIFREHFRLLDFYLAAVLGVSKGLSSGPRAELRHNPTIRFSLFPSIIDTILLRPPRAC